MRRLLLTLTIGLWGLVMLQHRVFAQHVPDTPGRFPTTSASSLMQVAEAEDAEGRQPDPCTSFQHTGFFGRFVEAYSHHLHDTGESSEPAPAYRGVPPAMDSPPFPYSTWPMGGTVPIGYSSGARGGPFMDTLSCSPVGDFFKKSRISIFGWLAPGVNVSTSRSTNFHIGSGIGGNYPLAYDVYPNSIQLDQATLYVERVPDTVQTDHVDWGFRLTNLYGTDYKYTFSHDILSDQYLTAKHRYGYDPVMAYLDVYIPRVAEGLNIRVGRYISLPDIEAQLAPDNLMYSHSLLYSYDPYTQTGIVATLKLTKNWIVQLEFSGGNDVAPWSPFTKPTPAACLSWTSSSGGDNIYTCANTVNGGQYGYNNINMFVATWYHKFDDRWHIATEAWYMFENQVPSVLVPSNTFIVNANGAVCDPGQIQCYAPEYAIVNYLLYKTSPKDYLGLRNEIFNDLRGQRTLFKTIYTSHTVAWVHWFGDVITLRPELRFEHSYATPAYDGGTKHNQFTAAADFVFHY